MAPRSLDLQERHEKRKKRSPNQVSTLQKARKLALAKKRGDQPSKAIEGPETPTYPSHTENLPAQIKDLKHRGKEQSQKLYAANRRNRRLQDAFSARKADLKRAEIDAYKLHSALELMKKELETLKKESTESHLYFTEQIRRLEAARNKIAYDKTILRKRHQRLKAAYAGLQNRYRDRLKKCPSALKMTWRGMYTPQARSLARLMVASGTAESKVGPTLCEIGKRLGVKLSRKMSKRTVQRAIIEGGIAASLQSAYDMKKASKISYSSDSTSHKHIEYESRTIALRIVDYANPDAEPKWRLRALGIGTSVNHTSETQVNGLKQRLEDIAELFNNSPLAKRENMKFHPDDFAYRLIGTSGDHAADQKKSHEILRVWRMDVILQRLGEEALFEMEVGAVVARLVPLKARQVEELGGLEAWERLTEDEKASADALIIREVGKEVFNNLSEEEQRKLTTFVRTGCCMHKDLNCFKAGDKAMQAMWAKLGQTPPILLANKDNAAVLAMQHSQSAPLTAAQARAEELSKRGGCHAAMLGGLICRNKDKKKGQHDTYDFFMEVHIGHQVSYPDVSNTRYGTHGDAGGTIIVYREHFRNFMDFIKNTKDKPGHTNIEKNFANAIVDIPTLTELCTMGLYNIAVSQPFMRYVRKHDNLLDLQPFFEKKTAFLERIAQNPEIWLAGEETPWETASVDGVEWEESAINVLVEVKNLAPQLPYLANAITAFVTGARTAFVERFSDEFKEGGGIDRLTSRERDKLYFASTNDANEGGLGSWRKGQLRRPRETLHKYNAAYQAAINGTEEFIRQKLSRDEDLLYIMRAARRLDESALPRKLKVAQINADKEKTVKNADKENRKKERRDDKAAEIQETSRKLALSAAEIDRLKNNELNRQLDFHREEEKKHRRPLSDLAVCENDPSISVPLKSYMKTKEKRIQALKYAAERYLARMGEASQVVLDASAATKIVEGNGDDYESDHFDDKT